MINPIPKATQRQRVYLVYIFTSQVNTKGSENEATAMEEWCTLDSAQVTFSCLFYTAQAHRTKDGPAHSGLALLHQLTIKKCLTDILIGQFDGEIPQLKFPLPKCVKLTTKIRVTHIHRD